jgi:ribonuclease HII
MITVGIDEVGRGCWAGPLVAGAVILPADMHQVRPGASATDVVGKTSGGDRWKYLRDSKKLSKLQRDKLAILIHAEALAVGIGWVTASELDAIGLTKAVGLAMKRAMEQIHIKFDEMIIDGNLNYFPDEPLAKAVIKADDSVLAVSAASIVAKVARDNYGRAR